MSDMNQTPAVSSGMAISLPEPRTRTATWIGLFVSLFGMLLSREVLKLILPGVTVKTTSIREALIFASAGFLLLLVGRWEKLPLRSIGIGTSPWWKSILWGLVTAVLCAGLGLVLIVATGYGNGPASAAFAKLPLWLITIVVTRAGIVEELFYRGYAIERLQSVGMSKWMAAAIPLIIFSVGHWTGGAANILIALVLGGVLTGFYLWRRDLVANMFAHFLVDFVANVVPALAK
jgi:CAAX protease family protein